MDKRKRVNAWKYVCIFLVSGLLWIGLWYLAEWAVISSAWSQLPYPGLSWDMSPEEVTDILDLESKGLTEYSIPSDLSGLPDELYLMVEDMECFAGKADSAVFRFSDYPLWDNARRGENYGLSSVQLMFRQDSISREELVRSIEAEYGRSAGGTQPVWYPRKGASDVIRGKELEQFYYEWDGYSLFEVYRMKADSFWEFKRLLKDYYLESINLQEKNDYYMVTISGAGITYAEQWLETKE